MGFDFKAHNVCFELSFGVDESGLKGISLLRILTFTIENEIIIHKDAYNKTLEENKLKNSYHSR